jgi:hypothetical protein
MKKLPLLLFLTSICFINVFAQKPYKCGFYSKDTNKLNHYYTETLQFIEVKKGEQIASVGAQNGNMEVQLSIFTDSITWTLNDIDTGCLNKEEFGKVLYYYETLANKKIASNFSLVLGTETKTNLKTNFYDRVLLINTYHELTDKNLIVDDIYNSLKSKGRLVIMERMGNKRNKKRRDCNHIMPYEPDFIEALKASHFILVDKKNAASKKSSIVFYVFEKS